MLDQPHLPTPRQPAKPSMPFDKQSNGKPITPALSSSFRPNTKSPLTPRLVASGPSSPASANRRDVFVRARSPARETPAPTNLNGNITPRSAARKSRIGTESPATPGSHNPATTARPRAISGAGSKIAPVSQPGLGISSPSDRVTPSPIAVPTAIKSATPAYAIHRRVSGTKSAVQGQDEVESKFFHADDARSFVSERPTPSTDTTNFFFVGSPVGQSSISPKVSPTRGDEKFFFASDVRSQTAPKPLARPVLPNKTVSMPGNTPRSQHIDSARPKPITSQSNSPTKVQSPSPQSSSPHKEEDRKILSPANPARQNVDRRGSGGSSLSLGKPEFYSGHQKTVSTSSVGSAAPRRPNSPHLAELPTLDQRLAELPSASPISLDRSTASAPAMPSFSPKPAQTSFTTTSPEPLNELLPTGGVSSPLHPTAITPSSDTFSDPSHTSAFRPQHDAANARRERKVLDLEISNSSLLAINKTLEKELRKQNTELRRFRRLSRSGRLSLAPTNRSISASTLDTVAEGEGEDFNQSEPEDDSDLDTIDDDETDVLSNDSSSVHSPTSRTRQRARDEKRLILDLSKHQQMLLDSQKLTQSIRRCLTCTEELIRDGNKALEYKVGIGDIRLGGRVLNHEELDEKDSENSEEETQQRRGLLSPSVTLSQLEEATLWLTSGVGSGSDQPEEVNGTLDAINKELDVF